MRCQSNHFVFWQFKYCSFISYMPLNYRMYVKLWPQNFEYAGNFVKKIFLFEIELSQVTNIISWSSCSRDYYKMYIFFNCDSFIGASGLLYYGINNENITINMSLIHKHLWIFNTASKYIANIRDKFGFGFLEQPSMKINEDDKNIFVVLRRCSAGLIFLV